jgi:hypothetical protein
MTEPHDITVRKVKFEFPDELDDVLPGNDPVRETYMVAFSLTMPYLEPYLIRTLRSVADDITDPGAAANRTGHRDIAARFSNINDIVSGDICIKRDRRFTDIFHFFSILIHRWPRCFSRHNRIRRFLKQGTWIGSTSPRSLAIQGSAAACCLNRFRQSGFIGQRCFT